jgi:hypothetical protein
MDRRVAGIAVLVLALLAVVIVPSISGRRVVGTAVGLTFAAPPEVGDCVAPLPSGVLNTSSRTPEVPISAIELEASCSGPIGGEVVGVWPTQAAAQNDQFGSRRGGPCYRQVADYAGLQPFSRSIDVFGAPFDGRVSWKPTIGFKPINIVPGTLAAAGGQNWVACLAVPTLATTYHGTLRDAYVSGTLPDAFGLCWDGDDLDTAANLLHCDDPHPAELLATGWVQNRATISKAEIEASCRSVAGRIMRTADSTRQGAISIVADQVSQDGAQRGDEPLAVNCFVTAILPQRLSSTVVSLGDRPLPLLG